MSQDASQSLSLKEQGNAHFKAGRFADAVEFYTRAEKASLQDPVYPSNLSAALFELGDYASCVRAICRATERCLRPNDPLLSRLSLRLAKSLTYWLRGARAQAKLTDDASNSIERLSSVGEAPTASEDLGRAWHEWRHVESEIKRVSEGASAARLRLASLSIYRKTVDPMLEYYSIGHDHVMSIADDWGLEDKEKNPLHVKKLLLPRLSSLAFLFGGAGDARHVFGSIIGLKNSYLGLDDKRRALFKTHFTLVDIHSTALARDLCIFLLVDDLLEGKHSKTDEVEIYATLFYTYVGTIMPSYCYQRFQDTVQTLLRNLQSSPPVLPTYIHVAPASIPGIIGSLAYWSQELSDKTVRGFLRFLSDQDAATRKADLLSDPKHKALYANSVPRTWEERRQYHTDEIRNMPDEAVIRLMTAKGPQACPGAEKPAGRSKWLVAARAKMLEYSLAGSSNGARDSSTQEISMEANLYEQTTAFVPPAVLCTKHHPAFASAWEIYGDFGALTNKKRELGHALQKANEDIETTWKINPSLFDPFHDRQSGYPVRQNTFREVWSFEDFTKRFGLLGVPDAYSPSFSVLKKFFSAVIDALRKLKGSLVLEIIQGDIFQELRKIRLGEDASRPTGFPREYTRMWLSNVPDYTHGPLNTAIYAVPALECTKDSSVSSNCLLNTGFWQDGDQYCHNYALLTVEELPRFLGCLVVNMKGGYEKITLRRQQLPRPLKELAARDELHTWLTRVLLCTLIPPTPGKQSYRVRYPNNLVAFVNLLVHLHSVGFPSHWLTEFLSIIFSNGLVTNIAPFRGELPIPLSEKTRRVTNRKVNLDPWLVEFETIIAISYEAIPFPVSLPVGFAACSNEIGMFEVHLQEHMFTMMTGMRILPSFDPVMGLLFYNRARHSGTTLATRISDILEGRVDIKENDLHILTAVDTFDMPRGIVRWKMSKERVRKMKGEGWSMMPYRFDAREAAADATPASRWTEVPVSQT